MRGERTAVIARALGIPAPRIRKWAQLGLVCRYPDGSLDPNCVAAWECRKDLGADYREWHLARCRVSRLRTTAA